MDDKDQQSGGIGVHLKAARELMELSQEAVAAALRECGFAVKNKKTVSAWEKDRGLPNALVIKELARLYETTADALLGIEAHSERAARLAVAFDSLEPSAQAAFMQAWEPFFQAHANAEPVAGATNREYGIGHARPSPAAEPRRTSRTAPKGRRAAP